ncbi:hypothetical protein K402DRAFT_395416 [Aulographum hederae CBS 113979]|uniref:Uncharacterized protein n=1 Tax=Aulographum hederae CBS 113979 TaxID=1176131 RepID=A0A6G1GV89_9PEZI|nr:hypothetical protein K402DRAFT_395416 [Aulographum hederae CBS 113979]
MGNLCGKESKDNFAGNGRVLGSAPARPDNARSSIPSHPASKPTGAGHTLGGSSSEGREDPRAAAREAATVRCKPQFIPPNTRPMTTSVWM